MGLKIQIKKRSGNHYLVDLDGRLDGETWQRCQEELQPIFKKNPSAVTFDLADLDFISSMGIRVILITRKAVEVTGGKVFMVNLQPQIAKVFEITAALPKERIFESVDEADRYFASIQEKEINKQKCGD